MNIIESIILGLVQGLCEFLPISSSGHLVLFQKILGIESQGIFFEVMLHVGTLCAVIFYYRKRILEMLKNPFSKYTGLLVIATIPTVIVALLFGDQIEAAFSGAFLGVSFLITSVLLLIAERIPSGFKGLKEMSCKDAAIVGLFQAGAIIPGVSRSGSTITGSLVQKLDREFAAEFSFMMSIPAILGSLVLEIVNIIQGDVVIENIGVLSVVVGMIVAAVSGLFAIKVMVKILKEKKLTGFSIYTAILGLLVIFDQQITKIIF